MSFLELADNIFQIIVFGTVVVLANIFTINNRKSILLEYFAGSMACAFAGTLFWTVYFVIYGEFPYYFSAADLCYLCCYLFFMGICRKTFKDNITTFPTLVNRLTALIFPVLVIAINTLCYLLVGGLFYMAFYAVPLAILAYYVSLNVLMLWGKTDCKYAFYFHIILMLFIMFENLMFIFSSLYLNTPYLLFDVMLSLTSPAMLFLLKKEGEK